MGGCDKEVETGGRLRERKCAIIPNPDPNTPHPHPTSTLNPDPNPVPNSHLPQRHNLIVSQGYPKAVHLKGLKLAEVKHAVAVTVKETENPY